MNQQGQDPFSRALDPHLSLVAPVLGKAVLRPGGAQVSAGKGCITCEVSPERKEAGPKERDITAGTSHMSALRGQAESVSPVHTTITGFHMENSLLLGQVPGAG